jgi:hypothetical protein
MPQLGSSLTDAERARLTSQEVDFGLDDEAAHSSQDSEEDCEDAEEVHSLPISKTCKSTIL